MGAHLRILHVHCRYREAGGEDAVVAAERELLSRNGAEVIPFDEVNPSAPLPALARIALSPWNPRSFMNVRRAVKASKADVAHVHNTWFSLSPSVLEALRHMRVPTIATIHNYRLGCINGLLFRDGETCTDCIGQGPWPGIRHRCYRSSVTASAAAASSIALNRALSTWQRCVDRFLVLNSIAKDVLVAAGVPATNISRTANFTTDPGARAHAPSRSNTVLYVGRLSPEKGIDMMLRAWQEWRPSNEWSLVIVGDGPERVRLQRPALEGVRFLGRRPSLEVRNMMLEARALVIPSLVFENQPMVAIEALAAGLPVLGTAMGGTVDVLRPLGAKWTIGRLTSDAWVAGLAQLRDDAGVDVAGRHARRAYEQTHSVHAALARMRHLYGRVVRHQPTVNPS